MPQTYTEVFEEVCPQYLAMGMSYEQFWDDDPHIAVAYRKAYKLKRELDNENAWLQGAYVHYALAVNLKNAFSKGTKRENYLEQPLDIFPPSEAEKKRREAKEYEKMQKAMQAMQRQQRRKKQKGE